MPQPQLQGNTVLAQPNNSDVKAATQQPIPFPTPATSPFKEYVAGGPLTYLQNYYRALPQYIDDISQDLGLDIYERMLKDAQVTSAFESVRMAVLASGYTINGKVQDEQDPDFAQSEEIKEFIESCFTRRLNQPFMQICYDLLEGMAYGHKVAELVYEVVTEEGSDYTGKIVLKAIKVKPQRSTAFVVDAFYNVVAVIGIMPGQGSLSVIVQGVIGVPDPNDKTGAARDLPINTLPREKFAIFSFRPQDSDPRGTSILRPAFDPWWCKTQIKKDYLAYMARFASPSLIGYTPEDSVSLPVSDSYTNPTPDTNGTQQFLSPEQIMGSTLAAFKNGTYMVLPGGSKVDTLESQGSGEAFKTAFDFYNSEITKGIQYQTLATNEGQHQARAASQTHENVKDMVINFAKEALAVTVNQDIIYNLVRYNYGEDVAQRLAPEISFAEGAAQDFATDATAIAALQTAGYLHISQYEGIDSRLGLPQRDLKAQMADMQNQQALQQKALEAKLNQPDPNPQENQGNQNQDQSQNQQDQQDPGKGEN